MLSDLLTCSGRQFPMGVGDFDYAGERAYYARPVTEVRD